MSFAPACEATRIASGRSEITRSGGPWILRAETAPAAALGRASGGVPASPPAAAGADLARGAAMIAPNLPGPSARPVQPTRSIPIHTVSRAAIEALVARLVAEGFRHVVTVERSPYGC